MGQTAKYCEECSKKFSKLPPYEQNEKQKEFLKAGKFKPSSVVDYDKTVKTETGTCEDCRQTDVVYFYSL